MPFKKWLEKHDLNLIMPLFYETQTSQGYGYIEEVPTYYGTPDVHATPLPPCPLGLGLLHVTGRNAAHIARTEWLR